jgi:hypothetical protein
MQSEFFVPLEDVASAICRSKKTVENWIDAEGKFSVGGRTIQTLKIGGRRVVGRPVLDDLILHLLQQAGVSPDAAARLVTRQPAPAPHQEEEVPPTPRRGRPRNAAKRAGGAA